MEQRQSVLGAADHGSSLTMTISNDGQPVSSEPPSPQANTSFSSLPFDLFIAIVQLVISLESEFSPTHDIRVLHHISAVCRHWRWTALNTPSFWAYIPSYLPLDVLQVFLRRSVDALLHVDLVYDGYFADPRMGEVGPPSPEVKFLAKLDKILPLRHRIRFLSLTLSASALTSTSINTHLADCASCGTATLEGLRFRRADIWRLEEKHIVDAEIHVFSKFRGPLLRELHFDGVVIPREHFSVSSLAKLSLSLSRSGGVFEELKNVLNRSDHLNSLSLDLLKIRNCSTYKGKHQSIALPKLRQLSMKGTAEICFLVYIVLDSPLLEEVHLETGCSNVEFATGIIPPGPAGHLDLKVDEPIVRLGFTASGDRARGTERPFSLTLTSLFSKGNALSNYNILLRLLGSHHFTHIGSLDFSTSSHYDLTFISRLLSHLPALHDLRIGFTNDGSTNSGGEPTFAINDAIDLDMLRSSTAPLRSLRSLAFRNFAVVLPQSSAFLLELSAIVQLRSELTTLVLMFEECQGMTDELLQVCGLKVL